MLSVLVSLTLLQIGPPAGILIERRLAEELTLSVGDTVEAEVLGGEAPGRWFVVEGVFERPPDPNRIARNEVEVRFHLPELEEMLEAPNRVDRFAVMLRPTADPDSVARWVESLAFGTQVYGATTLAEQSSTTFRVVSRFHDAIGLVTLLASGIFLLCLMVIRVDERRADIRTMRLVGISRSTIVRAVVLEAMAIAAVGSLFGILLGALLARAVNAYYAAYYDTTLRFAIVTGDLLLLALLLGVTLGIGAGALAALRLVGVAPQRLGER
jgi:putative ABC transport system permease protein